MSKLTVILKGLSALRLVKRRVRRESFDSVLKSIGFHEGKTPESIGTALTVGTLSSGLALLKGHSADLKIVQPKYKAEDFPDVITTARVSMETTPSVTVRDGLISLPKRTLKGGKKITAYMQEGAKLYSGSAHGLSYKSERTRMYHNLGNLTWKPGTQFYEGQVGYEEMTYKGDEGDARVTRFAIFSDPYYSIKANFYHSVVGLSATNKKFTQDYSVYKKAYAFIIKHGKKVPPNKKTLYRVMSHYAPYGDLNDPEAYAHRIVNTDPYAWPEGIDTMVDLKASKRQFVSFYKEVLRTEQGTTVQDWYLEAVYDAMFNGAEPPLQEKYGSNSTKVYTTYQSTKSVSQGTINYNDDVGNSFGNAQS